MFFLQAHRPSLTRVLACEDTAFALGDELAHGHDDMTDFGRFSTRKINNKLVHDLVYFNS